MFKKYWIKIKIANPYLNDVNAKMTISVTNFHKQLKKAYEAGMAEGEWVAAKRVQAAKDFANIKQPDSSSDGVLDMFKSIVKGRNNG